MIQATYADLFREGHDRLSAVGLIDTHRDCIRLMQHVLGNPVSLPTGNETADADAADTFLETIAMRSEHVPIAQIVGRREFYGLDIHVDKNVLVPRPESETLVDVASRIEFDTLLDIGTGSGCLLLALLELKLHVRGTGVDISGEAIRVARQNATTLGLSGRSRFMVSNWFSNDTLGRYDLIISNPPYTSEEEYCCLDREVREHEPRQALTLGGNGTEAYEIITSQSRAHMQPGGWLLFEIGIGQFNAVRGILESNGYLLRMIGRDMDDRIRVLAAQAA